MKTLQDKLYGRLSDRIVFFADRDMTEMFQPINLIEDEVYSVGLKNLPDEEFRTELVIALKNLEKAHTLTDEEKDIVDEFIHDIENNLV